MFEYIWYKTVYYAIQHVCFASLLLRHRNPRRSVSAPAAAYFQLHTSGTRVHRVAHAESVTGAPPCIVRACLCVEIFKMFAVLAVCVFNVASVVCVYAISIYGSIT